MNRNTYRRIIRREMLESLHYPVDDQGQLIDGNPAIFAGLAGHLERDGWRKPYAMELIPEYDAPLIKKRKVYGGGVYEDAHIWVPFNTPDDPLEHLADMTMAQIEALKPEDVKLEAKRRLGMLPPEPEQTEPNPPAWSVAPTITITDAPDTDTEWSK